MAFKLHLIFFGAVFSGCACCLYLYYSRRSRIEQSERVNNVLFFPIRNGSRNALGSRQNESNVFYLFDVISTATKSIDAAIYAITARDFSDILINAHRRGVVIRILTDNEQQGLPNSQIQQLRRAGIQVRHNTSFFMHHKFVVVDSKCLVTGSLNWTNQALHGNNENVIVTTADDLVQPFDNEFEYLWELYDPLKV